MWCISFYMRCDDHRQSNEPQQHPKKGRKKNHRSQLGLMFHGSLKKGDETGPILWFPLFSHSWWNSIRRPRSLCVAPGIKRERGLLFICDGWSHPVFIVSQTQIHSGWNLCLKNVCVAALMLLSYLYIFIYCFFFLFLNTFSCFQWRWIRFKISERWTFSIIIFFWNQGIRFVHRPTKWFQMDKTFHR